MEPKLCLLYMGNAIFITFQYPKVCTWKLDSLSSKNTFQFSLFS